MKQVIVQPRRSGKTTWLLEQYNNQYFDKEYVCCNAYQISYLNDSFNNEVQFKSISNICHSLECEYVNRKNYTFYLDEYFLYPKKEREYITKYLINNNCNFIAIGTPDKLYNSQDIECIQTWRKNYIGLRHLNKMLKTEAQMKEEFGSDLMYNLISYNEVEVKLWNDYRLSAWPKEQYETEVLGKLYV